MNFGVRMEFLEPLTGVGNPWCTSWVKRYDYLSSLIDRLGEQEPVDSTHCAQDIPSTPITDDDAVEPRKDELSHDVIRNFFDGLIHDPEQPVNSDYGHLNPQLLDVDKWHSCMANEWSKYSETDLLSTLLRMLDELQPHLSDSSQLSTTGFIMTLLLEVYIMRVHRPVPHTLAERILGLLKLTDGCWFVVKFVLPTFLLLNHGRNCSFCMTLLPNLTCAQRKQLLINLCESSKIWPSQSYNVIRCLLDPPKSSAPDLDILSTGDNSSVVKGFHRQYMLSADLYRSVPFANILMHFLRNCGYVDLTQEDWSILSDLVQKQDNFLRNPLLQQLDSVQCVSRSAPRSPVL